LAQVTDFNLSNFNLMLATGMSMLMALLFGAIAFLLTSMGGAGRAASIGLSTLIALGGYIISSLDGTVKWLRWPAKVFPFHYYKPSEIIDGTASWHSAVIFVVIIIGITIVSVIAFRRRDVASRQ
jgi:ABC-type transport system involved in multi-copper enzyme maturation permease subunit